MIEKGTPLQIYNMLLAGEKLQLSFPTMADARYLRSRISVIKLRQERLLASIGGEYGGLSEDEIDVFSCSFTKRDEPDVVVVMHFERKERVGKQYLYTILPRDDE